MAAFLFNELEEIGFLSENSEALTKLWLMNDDKSWFLRKRRPVVMKTQQNVFLRAFLCYITLTWILTTEKLTNLERKKYLRSLHAFRCCWSCFEKSFPVDGDSFTSTSLEPFKKLLQNATKPNYWQSQKDICFFILQVTPCTTEKLPKDQQRLGNYISSLGKTRRSHEKIVGCARNSETSLDSDESTSWTHKRLLMHFELLNKRYAVLFF